MPTSSPKKPLNIFSKTQTGIIVSVVMATITLGLGIFALNKIFVFDQTTESTRWALAHGMDGGIQGKLNVQFEDDINSLKDEQKLLIARVDALSNITDQTALSAEVTSIKISVDDLNNRFSKIEVLLAQDPEKALEIPLMRKDLDNLGTTTDLQIALLRQDIERSYTIMFVTIVTLAIAVLASGLGNMSKKGEKQKDNNKE